jgi:hypothetical protein
MSIEAMKQALEALSYVMSHGVAVQQAKDILLEAIEQAEKREWVGLTDEEIGKVITQSEITLKNYCSEDKQTEYARAIESKLKEKNA